MDCEQAMRELTIEEWANRVAVASVGDIRIMLHGMESRAYRKGRKSMTPVAESFERAYRYALIALERKDLPPEACPGGEDASVLLSAAKEAAASGYRDWFGQDESA
jgi:hypothetical protein